MRMHASTMVSYPVSMEKGRGPSNPGRWVTTFADRDDTGPRTRRHHSHGRSNIHEKKVQALLALVAMSETVILVDMNTHGRDISSLFVCTWWGAQS